MKQPKIVIKDAKRKGGKGYRVQSVAKNGEVLQSSQVLDTIPAVKKHIVSMSQLWADSNLISQNLVDLTKSQTMARNGWAKSGIDNKKLV